MQRKKFFVKNVFNKKIFPFFFFFPLSFKLLFGLSDWLKGEVWKFRTKNLVRERLNVRESSRVFSTKYSVSKGIKFNMYSRIWIDSIPSPNQRGRCFEGIECCARANAAISFHASSKVILLDAASKSKIDHVLLAFTLDTMKWRESLNFIKRRSISAPLSFYFGKQKRSSDCWWMEKNKYYRVFVCRDRNFPREGIYWK